MKFSDEKINTVIVKNLSDNEIIIDSFEDQCFLYLITDYKNVPFPKDDRDAKAGGDLPPIRINLKTYEVSRINFMTLPLEYLSKNQTFSFSEIIKSIHEKKYLDLGDIYDFVISEYSEDFFDTFRFLNCDDEYINMEFFNLESLNIMLLFLKALNLKTLIEPNNILKVYRIPCVSN